MVALGQSLLVFMRTMTIYGASSSWREGGGALYIFGCRSFMRFGGTLLIEDATNADDQIIAIENEFVFALLLL